MHLHVILDLPGIDAAQVDPHTLADELLRGEFASITTGGYLLNDNDPSRTETFPYPDDLLDARYISAGWRQPVTREQLEEALRSSRSAAITRTPPRAWDVANVMQVLEKLDLLP